MAVKPKGQDKVFAALNKSIQGIRGRTHTGIMRAVNKVKTDAIKKTPVDTGNLRGSFYTKPLVFKKDYPAGEIGNTAEYAVYVHENLESNHPVGEAMYLGKAIVENKNEILRLITQDLKV